MKIQSLSIVVPNKTCVNNCAFCVSKMHCEEYENLMDDNQPYFDLALKDYIKRLEFARDNGCNTVMLTGRSEPQQNRRFLTWFGMMMSMMKNPFRWVEMQTTGVMLDPNYLRFLRNHVGVNLISLSLSSMDDHMNRSIIHAPENLMPKLANLCEQIKEYGFSLRLSLNLTSEFRKYDVMPWALFQECKRLGADQVTLRVLYLSDDEDSVQNNWIRECAMHAGSVSLIRDYIAKKGRILGVLPHGAIKYSIDGLCVVLDQDCMDKGEKTDDNYKYLILQPDCRLYSQWDDPASLIF